MIVLPPYTYFNPIASYCAVHYKVVIPGNYMYFHPNEHTKKLILLGFILSSNGVRTIIAFTSAIVVEAWASTTNFSPLRVFTVKFMMCVCYWCMQLCIVSD